MYKKWQHRVNIFCREYIWYWIYITALWYSSDIFYIEMCWKYTNISMLWKLWYQWTSCNMVQVSLHTCSEVKNKVQIAGRGWLVIIYSGGIEVSDKFKAAHIFVSGLQSPVSLQPRHCPCQCARFWLEEYYERVEPKPV